MFNCLISHLGKQRPRWVAATNQSMQQLDTRVFNCSVTRDPPHFTAESSESREGPQGLWTSSTVDPSVLYKLGPVLEMLRF